MAGIQVGWTGNSSPDNRIVFEATRQMSPGVSFVSDSEYRYLVDVDGDDSNPLEVLPYYEAVFGELQSGQRIFFRLRAINKETTAGGGLASDVIEGSALVDA